MLKLDLFCKVVDNFGDIGVCWRLAKQLRHEHDIEVKLYIDDMQTAKRLIHELQPSLASQTIEGVEIRPWPLSISHHDIPDIVIEAFACDLPAAYQQAMQAKPPVWINLEYLSAESWVEEYHANTSIHPQSAMRKTFFFPGFTDKTGGLIREKNLKLDRQDFQASQAAQSEFWQQLGINATEGIKVSMFCYPHAPIHTLLDSMANSITPVQLFVPEGIACQAIQSHFNVSELKAGNQITHQQLCMHVIPFLAQPYYDKLLWACDLNFVRGEDSWTRALWSAVPFIWQPYHQQENTHLAKLEAFLDIYAPEELSLQQAHHAWLGTGFTDALWDTLCIENEALKSHASSATSIFEKQADLASKLVIFCKNHL